MRVYNMYKIVGIAHAVGDALGAPYERYHNTDREWTGRMTLPPRTHSEYHGIREGVVGQWTDDTEMAACLVWSMLKLGWNYDRDVVLLKYMQWANSKPIGMGKHTASLFRGIKTLKSYAKRAAALLADPANLQSNGSLMRAWPLAFEKDHSYETVIADCDLTNPNDINRDCSMVYIMILRKFIYGRAEFDFSCAKSELVQLWIDYALSDALKGTFSVQFKPDSHSWVIYGLYFAVWAAVVPIEEPHKIYEAILSCRIDPDTTCAIAGAVIGARFGRALLADPVFAEWRDTVLGCDTSGGAWPRPEDLRPATYYG